MRSLFSTYPVSSTSSGSKMNGLSPLQVDGNWRKMMRKAKDRCIVAGIDKLKKILGNDTNGIPGNYSKMNSCRLPVLLVSRHNHKLPIGDPTLTFLRDNKSRAVTGYTLSFSDPVQSSSKDRLCATEMTRGVLDTHILEAIPLNDEAKILTAGKVEAFNGKPGTKAPR
jgi:hypothetical protein